MKSVRLATFSTNIYPYHFAQQGDALPLPFETANASEKRARAQCRVLLVEDDFLIASLAEDTLTAAGYTLIPTATTAAEAIRVALSERPNIILMDIRLAGARDGIFAATEIYTQTGIRCIYTTAHTDEATKQRAAPTRPLDWIAKPYDQKHLLRSIARVLDDTDGTSS
jgi:DNA-binding NtrC family response regulator